MATGLAKAAKKFDAAFAKLPLHTKNQVMAAIWRAAPAFAQYQKDLAPIAESEELRDAMWNVVLAAAVRFTLKGRNGIGPKQIEEMREAAPVTADFMERVGAMIGGALGLAPIDVTPAQQAIAERDAAEDK